MASKNPKEISREISRMKDEITEMKKITEKSGNLKTEDVDAKTLINVMLLQNERTDKILMGMMEQLKRLEEDLRYDMEPEMESEQFAMKPAEQGSEIGLSHVDAKIVNFLQTRHNEMACAEDISKFMNYKGKNAACARLKKLEEKKLVNRYQLGHTVYYKIDTGKTTNTLIVSPPQ